VFEVGVKDNIEDGMCILKIFVNLKTIYVILAGYIQYLLVMRSIDLKNI